MGTLPATSRARWSGIMLGLAALSHSFASEACGGLFCSNAAVNQTAERIIFADHGDGRMTAAIEIKYEGPAERFSWVVPVPGIPDVGLSSEQALDRVQQLSNPIFRLVNEFEESCDFGGFADAGAFGGGADAGAPLDADEPEVRVVAADSVGPFDYQVIQVDSEAKNPAAVAIEWLETNDYDVTALGEEILGDYLKSNMNLIAFRLNKSADSGSIRPVTLTYKADRAMIPIRPTAVAATEDMGVLVWVLGKNRAVPTNYRTLELNEKLINWFSPSLTYNDVVIAAANEAGGQGFVTELAGTSDDYAESVLLDWEKRRWQTISSMTSADKRLDLLLQSAETFGALDGYVDAVKESVPLREEVSAEEFVECPSCYFDRYRAVPELSDAGLEGHSTVTFPDADEDPIGALDSLKFVTSLEKLVFGPLAETQALFDEADYVTRLYTTLSPNEMTKDPEFDFNPDLEDVSNRHSRTRVVSCTPEGDVWEIDFDGTIVRGKERDWPIEPGSLPANQRILQLSTSGTGEVIIDNGEMIEKTVGRMDPTVTDPDGRTTDIDDASDPRGKPNSNADNDAKTSSSTPAKTTSGGCQLGAAPPPLAPLSGLTWLALCFFGLRRRTPER